MVISSQDSEHLTQPSCFFRRERTCSLSRCNLCPWRSARQRRRSWCHFFFDWPIDDFLMRALQASPTPVWPPASCPASPPSRCRLPCTLWGASALLLIVLRLSTCCWTAAGTLLLLHCSLHFLSCQLALPVFCFTIAGIYRFSMCWLRRFEVHNPFCCRCSVITGQIICVDAGLGSLHPQKRG
jgi:hypothetical protein